MPNFKYCIVPKCTSTTIKTPKKLFFNVPKDPKLRKKWCTVMKRKGKAPLSCLSSRYCCEDHFDVEADMENYIKYKLMGGMLKLKKEVLPHKFDCQKPKKKIAERPEIKKELDIEYLEPVISKNVKQEILMPDPVEYIEIKYENDPLLIPEIINDVAAESHQTGRKTKGVQVNIKKAVKTKFTNTPSLCNQTNSRGIKTNASFTSDTHSLTTTSSIKDTDADSESCNLEFIKSVNEISFKEHMQKGALMAASLEPKILLGIPNHSKFCLEHLQKSTSLSNIEIIVTLRKIRWGEHNTMLAIHFGVSESLICKYIQEGIPKIAHCLKELIFFPTAEETRKNLPKPSIKIYSKVTSIIECFKVQIKKPSDATHHDLTWLQYKNSNTIKFLISFTPDGMINFISGGYGGQTSDSKIFEDCGFLDVLTPGSLVLVDRRFTNIAHLLEQKQCKLLRSHKKFAALRVHVERSIGRLREFQMVGPHASVDTSYIQMLDDIMAIVCGIVNLQD